MTKTQLAFFGTESKSGSRLQGLNEGLLSGALCTYIYYHTVKGENNPDPVTDIHCHDKNHKLTSFSNPVLKCNLISQRTTNPPELKSADKHIYHTQLAYKVSETCHICPQ